MAGPDFAIPGEAGEIALEPYTNADAGFSTLIPSGWNELMPGVYTRGNLAVDPTLIGQIAVPTAAKDITLEEMLGELGAGAMPANPVWSLDTDALAWSVYLIPSDIMYAAVLAESGGTACVAILRASSDEFDGLVEELLIPALMVFTPAE